VAQSFFKGDSDMTTSISDWRVLVVEDEQDSMDVVQEILGHYNIPTYGAYSAEDALSMIDEVRPTLAILDLALPAMDGWGLLAAMRNNPVTANIPTVAVTAFHSANVAQQAIQAGFDAYFSKPIEATSFVRELERIVNGG
jgi:CheY-like chemotaxis protein